MGRTLAPVLLVTALSCSPVAAEQTLIQPSSYGTSFEGPALGLECVGTLKTKGERGLVDSFRDKSSGERRACLEQLLRSLTPEPGFSPEEFHRSLKQTAPGRWELAPEAAIARAMTDRLGVNVHVAQGVAALADARLIDDPAALRPLVDCLDHPLLDVGRHCHRALASLTRHTYGSAFFRRSMGAPALTRENHQRAVAAWRDLITRLARGHPIYDGFLASECLAAIRAVGARLITALRPSPAVEAYLKNLADAAISPGTWEETIFSFDVGSHNTASWPRTDRISRIALVLSRPGVPRPTPEGSYHETFPALDLEVRFDIGTSDEALRRVAVWAVNEALNGLRAVNAKAAPP